MDGGGGVLVLGNNIGPIIPSFDSTCHENAIEPLYSGHYTIASNYIHDTYAITIYIGGFDKTTEYVYNNLIWNSGPPAISIDPSSSGLGTNYIWNNTIICPTSYPIRVVPKVGEVGMLEVRNNHFVTGVTAIQVQATVTTLVADHNLTNTLAQATSAGYTAANLWAPTSSSSPTVDHGVRESSLFITDILGMRRPRGFAWDIGAYEYTTGGTSMSPPPNLHVIAVGP